MNTIVNKKSVLEMAMGGILQITDYEIERIIANISDPNTDPKAKRKVTLTLTFQPDDYRERIDLQVQAKTTLAPVAPVRTAVCITKDREGRVLLAEMLPQVSGQMDIDGGEAPEPAIARVGRMVHY